MSEPSKLWRRTALAARMLGCGLAVAVALVGCGGNGGPDNGGGPGNPFDPQNDFYLSGGFFARPITNLDGELVEIINPASLYETDPLTGVALPGFPKALVPGTPLDQLASLNFDQILDALTPQVPVVPRNAALVLEFSKDVEPASLKLGGAEGQATQVTPVQVRRQDGSMVSVKIRVDGPRVILLPVLGEAVGWEASPLVFDKFGTAVSDPTGFLRVVTDGSPFSLKAKSGQVLVERPDQLGSVAKPLPFNPGNSALDAIVLQSSGGLIKFNGFLPDLTAPRIIRPVEASGTIDAINVVSDGPDTFVEITGTPLPTPANTVANGGSGEWAKALMEVTGTGGLVTRYVVLKNVNQAGPPIKPVFRLAAGTTLDPSVVVSNAFKVTRSEFWEPIAPPLPANAAELAKLTVDPVNHPRDILDPQDLVNHDLRRFVRMFDENGVERLDRWNPVTGLFLSVPPKTSLRLRFSEPMDVAAFRPYETFLVNEVSIAKTEAGFRTQRIGKTVAQSAGREISFLPFLDNQIDPSKSSFIGFGGSQSSLKLVMRTLPDQAAIASILENSSPDQLSKLVDLNAKGVMGITDLGGRGLGLPSAMIDQGNTTHFLLQPTSVGLGAFPPAVDFELPFQTDPSSDPDYGVIVHRFMGQPVSAVITYPAGSMHDSVTQGVEYTDFPPEDNDNNGVIDRRFIYGPAIVDIGLTQPGRLTGAPASTIQHVVDDFNAPAISPSSPTGQDVLTAIGFGTALPLNSPFGCRFQQIYRAGDASPAYTAYKGVVLDLVGLAWTPLQDQITNIVVQDMEILVGLSHTNQGLGPDTNQENGIPTDGNSGLIDQFDCNLLEYAKNCCAFINGMSTSLKQLMPTEPVQATVVKAGTSYPVLKNKLFAPANSVGKPLGTFNMYLDYPAFNAGVDPYFGKSDTFSFPYDSEFPMLIEMRLKPNKGNIPTGFNNFYRFSPGVVSSSLPRFRVWSQGQHPLAWGVPNTITLGSIIGCGAKAGEGGPLVEPGSITANIYPPFPNNGQPVIKANVGYILPPKSTDPPCVQRQTESTADYTPTTPPTPPVASNLPEANWYFANGMLAYPLPNLACYPGPTAPVPSSWYGYGTTNFTGNCGIIEPRYNCDQQQGGYGDNSRYYMMWKYRKRISLIESPTIEAESPSGLVHYLVPIVEPPVASADPSAGLSVEFKAGIQLDFAVPVLDSGYVKQDDPDFENKMTGFEGLSQDRIFVKFRATFAVAKGASQPPSIDTVVIPYIKVSP